MRKYISKFGLIFLMAFVIGIGYGVSAKADDNDSSVIGTTNLNGTVENSAKVGDQLKEPEKGWKRYDDSDNRIIYGNDFRRWTNSNEGIDGFYRLTSSGAANIKFRCLTDKIRLIDYMAINDDCSKKIQIKIDNEIVDNYSRFSSYNLGNNRQRILYEKKNLEYTIHTIEIINLEPEKKSALDAIDIDEKGKLLPYDNTNLTATVDNKKQSISLNWDSVNGATGYNVKRLTTQGSGYEIIASNVKENNYVDENVQAGKTYYYIVTPIINGKEGTPSNEASAIIEKSTKPDTKPEVKGDAVLFITMTNGNIKSYNVSMKTVNDFIEWYEDRASGSSGKPFYKFDKSKNEDKIVTEYIIFDKISSFQVEENK